MSCHHPLRAWRTQTGEIKLTKEPPDAYTLRLPCGGCLGCRQAHARAWALRCQLELNQHDAAVFTTLTYSDESLPPTLEKRHLQLWLKRLRKSSERPIRFFASGEYGTRTQRPHFHAILYGIAIADQQLIDQAWQLGITRSYAANNKTIAYVAGYTDKKNGWKQQQQERVDPATGEVYTWQPPFIQMSRRPGIGGHARQWPESWRLYAILDGYKMPPPRFLHEAWKQQATPQQKEDLEREKIKYAILRDTSPARLEAAEKIAVAKQAIQAARRNI